VTAAATDLLRKNQKIREAEEELRIAQHRRRWSRTSLLLGPLGFFLLYCSKWITINGVDYDPFRYVILPISIMFSVYALWSILSWSGGVDFPKKRTARQRLSDAELELALLREGKRVFAGQHELSLDTRRKAYKEETAEDIAGFREESTGFRRVHNLLQTILIFGSFGATGASGIAALAPSVRWITMGVTFAVGIAGGFAGYYKFRERSFYLQQTADAIEQESDAYELGIGRYKRISDPEEALADFVEEVHRLKTEQKKREQNLEQAPESRDAARERG
jgi:hypothetical protein